MNPDKSRLEMFLARVESVREQISHMQEDVREIKAQAKAEGFGMKEFNEILKLRAMTPEVRVDYLNGRDAMELALGLNGGE